MVISTQNTMTAQRAYPLLRRYLTFALPGLLASLLLLVITIVWSGRSIIIGQYMTIAQRQAQAIAAAVQREQPAMWEKMTDGTVRQPLDWQSPPWIALDALFDELVANRDFKKLKIYNALGIVLYSSDRDEIGTTEQSYGVINTLATKRPTAVLNSLDDGPVYELYTYLLPEPGRGPLLMELYEPETWLSKLLTVSAVFLLIVPLTIFGLLLAGLTLLVFRAQSQINRQTGLAIELQGRIEKLVSRRAVSASQLDSAPTDSHLLPASLYYADIRDFSGYAEQNPPAVSVQMLNRMIDIQVAQIEAFGGDIDKIMGDALLAVFTGDNRTDQAIACAQAVLQACAAWPQVPRKLGIGIHDGQVIAGRIGSSNRQDFTVIGDAVNITARLSDLAAGGELVVDTRTLERTQKQAGFSAAQEVLLKGRSKPVQIKRWQASAASA